VSAAGEPAVYTCGRWEIDLELRELRFDGGAVPIGPRPFGIVALLVRAAGQLLTKDQLMDRIWPGAIVEDNALQAHISAIRKAFGPDRGLLHTESGRGYRLLGTWTGGRELHRPRRLPRRQSRRLDRTLRIYRRSRPVLLVEKGRSSIC
jgi:DNA-binding winged helix-turn-helix (wHTH) protein